MALAPIWSMRPMSNFNLPDLPLLQLSPDASGDWDAVSRNKANLKYENGVLLGASEKPGGLWLKSAPNQTWTEPKITRFLTRTHVFRLNSLVFVTGQVAHLLRQLDLGAGG